MHDIVMWQRMGIKVALEHRSSYTFDRLVEVHPTLTRSATSWLGWYFPVGPCGLTVTIGLIADPKVISPDSARGRLGLLQLRAFEMPPNHPMAMVQSLSSGRWSPGSGTNRCAPR